MDRAAGLRWIVLVGALAATVCAVLYSGHQRSIRPPELAKTSPKRAPAKLLPSHAAFSSARTERHGEVINPFAPRGWESVAAPVAAEPAEVAEAPVPQEQHIPVALPTLPFKFVGRMHDGRSEVVYLRHGDNMLIAKDGETLLGMYKVISIGAGQIDFLHVSTGERQSMSLPLQDGQS